MVAKYFYILCLFLIVFNLSGCYIQKDILLIKNKNYTHIQNIIDDNIDSVIYKHDKKSYHIYNNFYYKDYLSDVVIDDYMFEDYLGSLELFLGDNKIYYIKFSSYDNQYNIIWKDDKRWKKYKKYWD